MKHFQRLKPEELAEISRKGGQAKHPKKGTGSLTKKQRVMQARKAANTRWKKESKDDR